MSGTSLASVSMVPSPSPPTVSRRRFGTLPDGAVVDLIHIRAAGIELSAITYGGIITSLRVPDRHGRWADVVLGFDRLDSYLINDAYIGALAGRYANRIAHGRFQLDATVHQLATTDPIICTGDTRGSAGRSGRRP